MLSRWLNRTLLLILGIILPCLIWSTPPEEPRIYCQKKWVELDWEGFKVQVLKLRAEAFPIGKKYTLFIRNCDGSETETFQYLANKKGHLIIQMTPDLKKGAPFAVTPLRRGEKISYCMMSEDEKEEYTVSIVPFPIGVSFEGGSVSVELSNASGRSFICVGDGFLPGAQILCTCLSGEMKSSVSIRIDEQGSFRCLVNPSIDGLASGTAIMHIAYPEGEVSLPFAWGTEAQAFVGAICLQIH